MVQMAYRYTVGSMIPAGQGAFLVITGSADGAFVFAPPHKRIPVIAWTFMFDYGPDRNSDDVKCSIEPVILTETGSMLWPEYRDGMPEPKPSVRIEVEPTAAPGLASPPIVTTGCRRGIPRAHGTLSWDCDTCEYVFTSDDGKERSMGYGRRKVELIEAQYRNRLQRCYERIGELQADLSAAQPASGSVPRETDPAPGALTPPTEDVVTAAERARRKDQPSKAGDEPAPSLPADQQNDQATPRCGFSPRYPIIEPRPSANKAASVALAECADRQDKPSGASCQAAKPSPEPPATLQHLIAAVVDRARYQCGYKGGGFDDECDCTCRNCVALDDAVGHLSNGLASRGLRWDDVERFAPSLRANVHPEVEGSEFGPVIARVRDLIARGTQGAWVTHPNPNADSDVYVVSTIDLEHSHVITPRSIDADQVMYLHNHALELVGALEHLLKERCAKTWKGDMDEQYVCGLLAHHVGPHVDQGGCASCDNPDSAAGEEDGRAPLSAMLQKQIDALRSAIEQACHARKVVCHSNGTVEDFCKAVKELAQEPPRDPQTAAEHAAATGTLSQREIAYKSRLQRCYEHIGDLEADIFTLEELVKDRGKLSAQRDAAVRDLAERTRQRDASLSRCDVLERAAGAVAQMCANAVKHGKTEESCAEAANRLNHALNETGRSEQPPESAVEQRGADLHAENVFVECVECARKSGTPVLCEGCRVNRLTIGHLKAQIEMLRTAIIGACRDRKLTCASTTASTTEYLCKAVKDLTRDLPKAPQPSAEYAAAICDAVAESYNRQCMQSPSTAPVDAPDKCQAARECAAAVRSAAKKLDGFFLCTNCGLHWPNDHGADDDHPGLCDPCANQKHAEQACDAAINKCAHMRDAQEVLREIYGRMRAVVWAHQRFVEAYDLHESTKAGTEERVRARNLMEQERAALPGPATTDLALRTRLRWSAETREKVQSATETYREMTGDKNGPSLAAKQKSDTGKEEQELAEAENELIAALKALTNLVSDAAARATKADQEREGWQETARQEIRNRDYFRGLVQQIGGMFGVAARTEDDGSVAEDVLCAKVPELVKALCDSATKDRQELDNAREAIRNQLDERSVAEQELATERQDIVRLRRLFGAQQSETAYEWIQRLHRSAIHCDKLQAVASVAQEVAAELESGISFDSPLANRLKEALASISDPIGPQSAPDAWESSLRWERECAAMHEVVERVRGILEASRGIPSRATMRAIGEAVFSYVPVPTTDLFLVLRPQLRWFAGRCEAKLRENDRKPHWSGCDHTYLHQCLLNAAHALRSPVDALATLHAACNVANYAMMLADNATGNGKAPREPDTSAPDKQEDWATRQLRKPGVRAGYEEERAKEQAATFGNAPEKAATTRTCTSAC